MECPSHHCLDTWKQTVIFAKWSHSVKVTTLLDQTNIALITSSFTLHHTVHLFTDVLIFVLVVIYINLERIRLYHFIHLPNCGITVLAKVPGFCPCVSTWPLISENALIQMNGAFQMKYFIGPNTAIFHLRNFCLRWDLNPGLPVEKPAVYPLLHELTLKVFSFFWWTLFGYV